MNNTENNNVNNTSTNAIPNGNNTNQGSVTPTTNTTTNSSNTTNNMNGVSSNPTPINVVSPTDVANAISNVPTNDSASGNSEVNSSNTSDPNAIENEKLKKVEINYQPPSKAKMVFTVFMLLSIIFFVIFLPEITEAINQYKAGKNASDDTIITTGRLECKLDSNTANLDINYSRVFKFTDSRINAADFTVTTRGDATLDEATLDDLATKCSMLKESTSSLNGVDVNCTHTEGKLVEVQKFDYTILNTEEIDAAFSEAGGTYPEFKNEQNIDDIEKSMNAAGYSCIRKK